MLEKSVQNSMHWFTINESSDDYNVNIMITRWEEKLKQILLCTCCYFDI